MILPLPSALLIALACREALSAPTNSLPILPHHRKPTSKIPLKRRDPSSALNRRQDAYESLDETTVNPVKSLYYGTVTFGSAGASFSLDFDTGSSLTWVQDSSCSDCPANPALTPSDDPSLSLTGQSNGITYQSGVSAQGATWTGPYSVGGVEANSGFVSATDVQGWQPALSGVLGLGLDCFHYDCAINALNLYGLGFYFSNDQDNGNGEVAFNGPDTGYTCSDFTYETLTTPENGAGWQFTINSWSVGDSSGDFSQTTAIADTGTLGLLLDSDSANSILTYINADPSTKQISCDGGPDIIFTFASGATYTLPASVYTLVGSGGNCYVPIFGYADGNTAPAVFGSLFMRAYYTYFDNSEGLLGFAENCDVFGG